MKNFLTKKNIVIIVITLVALVTATVVGILFFKKEIKNTYTISFNSDGGTDVSSITALEGEIVTLPENPTKNGYNFMYWSNDEGKPVSQELKLEKNISLTAIWAEKDKEMCKVTFDTDGGSTITEISVVKGEKLTLPDNPTKEGYEFKEWKDANDNVIGNDFSVEEDVTLKAVWTKNEKAKEKTKKETKEQPKEEPKEEPKEQPKEEPKEAPKEEPKNVEATEVALNSSDFAMVVRTSKTLKATVKPDNATNKNVEWSSSDNNIITVDNNGVVKAVGLGTAIIRAKTSNGKQAMISVTSEIKSISLSADRTAIAYKGVKEAKITANIDSNGYELPSSAITWYIPDASGPNAAASSSTSGKTATITARSNNVLGTIPVTIKVGKKEATTRITVEPSLYLYAASGNTTNFLSSGENRYNCTFSGEKTLSISSNVDVNWNFVANSPVIAGINTNSKRNLKLSVQYVKHNGLNIKAKTAGGQEKEVVVTPTL